MAVFRQVEFAGAARDGGPLRAVEVQAGRRPLSAQRLEGLVPQVYRAAVVEHRLFPITEPALENLNFEDDSDLSFELKVEIRPEVTAEKKTK